MESNQTVDVIIPTYAPDHTFRSLIKRLQAQTYPIHKIIIMNTDKNQFEDELVMDFDNVEVHHICKEEFNHGLTRNAGVELSDAEYVVFMTQDAVPANKNLIAELVKPFEDKDVFLAYGRQIPNKNCKDVEKYIRGFNYPDRDIVKTEKDLDTMGIKAIFCSDVCSIYRKDKFIELGRFPKTDFNEDTIFAYKVITSGGKVYYASQAQVIHSHNYSYIQQFKRNRDIGKNQRQFAYIFQNIKSESEGIKMVKSASKYFLQHGKWYCIPDLILSSAFKLLGYKSGKILQFF